MARPADPEIKEQILEEVMNAVSANGLHNLSLRGIGRETGISDRMLIFHFGSYENLIRSLLIRLSQRHKAMLSGIFAENPGQSLADSYRKFSGVIFDPDYRNSLLLFLEFYTRALRDPVSHHEFFEEVLRHWITATEAVIRQIHGRKAGIHATIMVAFYRGLMLDWLATGDTQRILKSQDELLRLILADHA